MDDRQLKVSPQQRRALTEYLDWHEKARSSGAISAALREYYSSDRDNVYSVVTSTKRVTLPILTKREWIDIDGEMSDFVDGVDGSERIYHHEKTVQGVAEETWVKRHRSADGRSEPAVFSLQDAVWNGRNYRITGVGDDAKLEVGTSDYFTYVSHHERLLRNFHTKLQSHGVETPREAREVVQRETFAGRDAVAGDFDAITEYRQHVHTLNAVCLLAIETETGDTVVYTVERSEDVLHNPGTNSVAPACGLSPDDNERADPGVSALRELEEELLGGVQSETSGQTTREVAEELFGSPDVVSVERTGLGFTMGAPRSVMAGLVHVTDEQVGRRLRRHMRKNWEIQKVQEHVLPFDDGIPSEMETNRASPSGLFSFLQGLQRLEEKGVETGVSFNATNPN